MLESGYRFFWSRKELVGVVWEIDLVTIIIIDITINFIFWLKLSVDLDQNE